jgi:lysophospholipase L1-like esterase
MRNRNERRIGARHALVALHLALAVTTAACLPQAGGFQGPPAGLKVGVIGDSLTQDIENGPGVDDTGMQFLTDEIVATGRRGSVVAMIGATTADLSGVNWPGADNPDIAVIGLGTNDGRIDLDSGAPRFSVSVIRGNIETYLARTNPQCTVLVNVIEASPADWRLDISGPEINAMLADEAQQNGYLLVDWNSTAAANPAYIKADGVHHTPEGRAAYTDAILDGIEQCAQEIEG